ncbi:hypothetical protein C6P45_004647 [Maudiozyma exigua]|uniref:Uncharacterized protein n=1 Tax=Maudiozyma exigua TaxID=34358 RepID=A0A9P7BA93_MAUEX|nr:hypothetical protein C6P45_004647 [Kazachstania exigua]
MYNKEVKDFFEIGQYEDYSIRPSRIHYKSQVRYVERLGDPGVLYNQSDDDDDDENTDLGENGSVEEIVGTLWTGQEKRTFFRLLSRYSIHRVSEWGQAIPEKSLYEIMEYYNILNENLNQLRKLKFKGLLKVADMDIAYDMDDQFVEMEEYMSKKLLYKQPYKRKTKLKDNDDQDKDDDDKDNKSIVKKEEPKIPELAPADISTNYVSDLIDLNNWERRWNAIYCKTYIEEIRTERKDFIPLGISSIIYVEQLVKQYLRRLLWYTILPEIENKKISKKALQSLLTLPKDRDEGEKTGSNENKRMNRSRKVSEMEEMEEKENKRYNYRDDDVVDVYNSHKKKKKHKKQKRNSIKPEDYFFPTIITGSEVERAITMMKNEQNGRFVQTLGESVIDTINKYKIDYKPRDGNIFRKSSVRESIIPEMIHQTASIYSTDKIQLGTHNSDFSIIDDPIDDSPSQVLIQDPWESKYDLQYKIPTKIREAREDALDLATDANDITRSAQICQTIYSYILEQK